MGLPFSDKKIITGNTEQEGTGGGSIGIPLVSQKRKTSEFRSEPFHGRENPAEFLSKPFSEENKPLNSVPDKCSKQKTLENPFQAIFGNRKKYIKNMTFVSCFVKLNYFAEFHSVSF
jgi:hypothetical protein